jgi:hypothetical protein
MTLMPQSSVERFHALWVAIAHGRQSIVSYLQEREKHRGASSGTPRNFWQKPSA